MTAAPPTPGTSAGAKGWLAALLLAAATFLVYAPVTELGFVDYDDGSYVTKNADVNAGLTAAGVRWAFLSTHSSNWHPLTWLSHMLDCELFGLEDPGGHHAVSAGLHALNAALCLLALLAFTRRLWPSVVVAALFALHPLRVESVAWVAERKDVLSGTFFFLTLLAHARYARRPGALSYGLVALALALGLLAKQMLVTLPFLLLLLDRWPLERLRPGTARRLVLEKLPLVALAVGAGLATLFAQHAGDAIRSFEALPLGVRLANAAVATVGYLVATLCPSDLAVFYPHPGLVTDDFAVLGPRVLGAAALLLALTAGAWRMRATRPELLVGWLGYLLLLAPVVGIVQVGAQWMADRYAYLTLVPVYVAVVFGLDRALRTARARAALVVAGLAAALACVPLTRAQIRVWTDTRTLFEHALAVTEHNYVAHINLGYLEHSQGNLDEAERHYLAALEVAPRMPDTHSNLGGIHLVRGEHDRARARLEHAIALDPTFVNAHLLLGVLEEEQGNPDAALRSFEAAVRAHPDSVEARLLLAEAQGRAGDFDTAIATLRETLRMHPNSGLARLELGETLMEAGRPREARDELERALRRASPPAETHEVLAWLLATSADAEVRDPARALELARTAVATANTWKGRRSLAAALASAGEWDAAATLALDAANDATGADQSELIELHRAFKERRGLFR
jgi:tetratricopeptide (TPR) repeat protein